MGKQTSYKRYDELVRVVPSKAVRKRGTEAERLAAKGFLPCGLSQTDIRCPECGRLLGRFRKGSAGGKYFRPDKDGETAYGLDGDGVTLFCGHCRHTYEE